MEQTGLARKKTLLGQTTTFLANFYGTAESHRWRGKPPAESLSVTSPDGAKTALKN